MPYVKAHEGIEIEVHILTLVSPLLRADRLLGAQIFISSGYQGPFLGNEVGE
jgi:hypothetical protein